jgi:hypothetical protein
MRSLTSRGSQTGLDLDARVKCVLLSQLRFLCQFAFYYSLDHVLLFMIAHVLSIILNGSY